MATATHIPPEGEGADPSHRNTRFFIYDGTTRAVPVAVEYTMDGNPESFHVPNFDGPAWTFSKNPDASLVEILATSRPVNLVSFTAGVSHYMQGDPVPPMAHKDRNSRFFLYEGTFPVVIECTMEGDPHKIFRPQVIDGQVQFVEDPDLNFLAEVAEVSPTVTFEQFNESIRRLIPAHVPVRKPAFDTFG